MKRASGLVLLALVAMLAACSERPRQLDEPSRAVAARRAPIETRREQPLTLTDADGNELDPEVADAVQESVERQEMERQEAGAGEGGDWGE